MVISLKNLKNGLVIRCIRLFQGNALIGLKDQCSKRWLEHLFLYKTGKNEQFWQNVLQNKFL